MASLPRSSATAAVARGRIAGLVAFACLATACQPAASEPDRSEPRAVGDAAAQPGRLVRLPDGRRINFRCSGRGEPTILLEGGHAATSLAWGRIQPELSRRYRVCAYDRAGLGFSDPGPLPRDGAAVARDLDRGLRAARIQGPFVVVGHSAGGLYVRLFANRRPHEVIGMVLAETSVEYQDRRFAALFGPNASSLEPIRVRALACQRAAERRALPSDDPKLSHCVAGPRPSQSDAAYAAQRAQALRASTWRTQVSELDNLWGRTSDQVGRGRPSYGDMPLIVLTAGDAFKTAPEPARMAVRQLWSDLHAEIAQRSTRGEARIVPGATHMIILDKPEAVIKAVDEVVAASRRKAQ